MRTIKVNRKDIPNTSDTPIFDYCRELIKYGEDPDSKLEVWRNNPTPDLTVDPISSGAILSVNHCRFVPYRGKHARSAI